MAEETLVAFVLTGFFKALPGPGMGSGLPESCLPGMAGSAFLPSCQAGKRVCLACWCNQERVVIKGVYFIGCLLKNFFYDPVSG